MSKKLPDWAYDLNNCTKCYDPVGHPSCAPCDPIDININVKCCCDCNGDDDGDEKCCCQQGVFEALNFLLEQDKVVDNIELYGFATGGGTNILSTGSITELTEDYVILNDNPTRVVSLCAIWIIQVPATKAFSIITEDACGATDTNCCCNPGLRERLLDIPDTQEVIVVLNNQDQSINRTVGAIRLVCNDSVWIQDCQGNQQPPSCTGVFYAIPLCNIAWFEPVV